MRLLHGDDIESLAVGAALLGGGGGGDPYISKLIARRAIAAHGPVPLVGIAELDDDALVASVGTIGAPMVGSERPVAEDTMCNAFLRLQAHLGQRIDAVMTVEVGGFNALAPVPVAARLGLPMVDADAMGRALPEIQQTSFSVHNLAASPMALAGDNGNCVLIEAADNHWAEQLTRSMTTDMGGSLCSAMYPMRASQLKVAGIPDSISRAIDLGRIFRTARARHQHPLAIIQETLQASVLFEGKVVDVQRQTDIGFARGQALIEGVGRYQAHKLTLQFQNEYLLAQIDGTVRASVPDILAMFDLRTGDPIPVETVRYGFQVAVLGFPAPPVWRTPAGLALVGPRAFGYPTDYIPFEDTRS